MSIIANLLAPTASNLAQKRVISINPAKSAKRKSKATVHNEPKISPTIRNKDFPNEFLTVSNIKLLLVQPSSAAAESFFFTLKFFQ